MPPIGALLAAAVSAALLTDPSSIATPAASPAEAAADKPSIVVIYTDDFSPLATWLWSDPGRTPTLARFVRDGVWFKEAIGSTPMCCPGRGNLLTGRYGHNSGITQNHMRGYDPTTSLGVRLQGAGYHTAYIGKYLNGVARRASTPVQMAAQSVGWDGFEVIWENQGAFYDYRWYTRSGTTDHGSAAADHSSFVAASAAVQEIRDAPLDKPLFMIVSLFDGHPPFTPMPRFEGHRACRNVRPWDGPAFDEIDVLDKPRYVRRTERLGMDSFDLRERCEETMTIDYVAGHVSAALEATGRLDDTLLVFTADNGVSYGDHRLVSKSYPYSTPVPLYMRWPARLGNERRVVSEPVSNVDLAPTFCAIGGCEVPDADGLSLVPLLLERASVLERDFIYEEMLHPGSRFGRVPKGRPAWYGLRTTGRHGGRRWVYTEYATGERELYDLTADRHQLTNLAGRPSHVVVERGLRTMLHEQVIEPDGVRFLDTLASPEDD